jgi:hypothetical protein
MIGGNTGSRLPGSRVVGYLTSAYGKPLSSNVEQKDTYTIHSAEFNSPAGKIKFVGFDITSGNVQQVDDDFIERFQTEAVDSDVVAYNGHAGHGRNVRAFTALSKLQSGRTYLYWINACKPYVYLDDVVFQRAKEANPGVPVGKYLHLATIAHVGFFAEGSDIIALVQSLVAKQDNYRTLLGKLHYAGVVIGDES